MGDTLDDLIAKSGLLKTTFGWIKREWRDKYIFCVPKNSDTRNFHIKNKSNFPAMIFAQSYII